MSPIARIVRRGAAEEVVDVRVIVKSVVRVGVAAAGGGSGREVVRVVLVFWMAGVGFKWDVEIVVVFREAADVSGRALRARRTNVRRRCMMKSNVGVEDVIQVCLMREKLKK